MKNNTMNFSQLPLLAKKSEAANKKLIARLASKKPKDLDKTVKQLHYSITAKINCLCCANCCSSISPILNKTDIARIARLLKINTSSFYDKYLIRDKEGDYVFNQTPCPFLLPGNYCSIYNHRPKACREYPHTNHKKISQTFHIIIKNTYICPIVYELLEELRKIY
jgi:hypothetical protein